MIEKLLPRAIKKKILAESIRAWNQSPLDAPSVIFEVDGDIGTRDDAIWWLTPSRKWALLRCEKPARAELMAFWAVQCHLCLKIKPLTWRVCENCEYSAYFLYRGETPRLVARDAQPTQKGMYLNG